MKRHLLVAFLVTVAVIGGLLALFPAKWVGLLLALMVLVTGQVILLRRHTTVLPYPPGSLPKPRTAPETGAARTPAGVAAAPGAPTSAEAPAGALPTAEVFSRFRAHLETMEQGAPAAGAAAAGPAPAATAPSPPADTPDAVTDRVELSSGAKGRPAPRAQAASPGAAAPEAAPPPAATPAAERVAALKPGAAEEEEADLFADLRPALAVGATGTPRAQADLPPPPPVQDEVGAALARAREPQHIQEEGAALIRIAQDALDEGDLPRAHTVLEQYESLLAETPDLATWEAARAELRLAAREQRADAVAPAYQAMLDRGYAPAEATLEEEIDALLEGLEPKGRDAAKVALLVKALAPFRQAGDRETMDHVYERIEAAQEHADDPRKLIQFYKNHLAIKEALNDAHGRLNLIDKIGNRYYQLGETAPAKEFYELGMKLRGELEQAGEPAPGEAPKNPDEAEPAPAQPTGSGEPGSG